jgi:hypothetical protein
MIELINELLSFNDYYGISKNIDIAKGGNELNTSIKKAWKQNKRKRYGSN